MNFAPSYPKRYLADTTQTWNYSNTLKLCRLFMGHAKVLPAFVRIWHRPGQDVLIGMEKHGKKIIMGGGATFKEAFENVFVKPYEKAEQLKRLAVEEELTSAAVKKYDEWAATPDVTIGATNDSQREQ